MGGERRVAYRIVVAKHERRRPLGKPRKSWEDNIKMDLQEGGWRGMDWVLLAQDKGRAAGSCEQNNKPSGSLKCGEFLDWLRTC